MENKALRSIAYCLTAVFLITGVICYAAFAKKAPENPIRIMFKNTGGKVLFDHKEHFSEEGYAIECMDCHHDMDSEGQRPEACGECHLSDGEDSPTLMDVLHMQCQGCHEDWGSGPVDCSECHMM